MTKLYAVLVGSLLLAGGSSAMARPDADDTLTQIHRLPNEIIGAAELKPVFRFGRRLQDGVSTLSGVQEDGLHADAGKNKDDTVSTGVQEDGVHADAGKSKDDTVFTAKAKAKAEAEAMEKARAKAKDIVQAGAEQVAQEAVNATLSASEKSQQQTIGRLKARLAYVRERMARYEMIVAKEEAECLAKASIKDARAKSEKQAEYVAVLEARLKREEAKEARMKAGR